MNARLYVPALVSAALTAVAAAAEPSAPLDLARALEARMASGDGVTLPEGVLDLYVSTNLADRLGWSVHSSHPATNAPVVFSIDPATVPGWHPATPHAHDAACTAATNIVVSPLDGTTVYTNVLWSCETRRPTEAAFFRLGTRADTDGDGTPELELSDAAGEIGSGSFGYESGEAAGIGTLWGTLRRNVAAHRCTAAESNGWSCSVCGCTRMQSFLFTVSKNGNAVRCGSQTRIHLSAQRAVNWTISPTPPDGMKLHATETDETGRTSLNGATVASGTSGSVSSVSFSTPGIDILTLCMPGFLGDEPETFCKVYPEFARVALHRYYILDETGSRPQNLPDGDDALAAVNVIWRQAGMEFYWASESEISNQTFAHELGHACGLDDLYVSMPGFSWQTLPIFDESLSRNDCPLDRNSANMLAVAVVAATLPVALGRQALSAPVAAAPMPPLPAASSDYWAVVSNCLLGLNRAAFFPNGMPTDEDFGAWFQSETNSKARTIASHAIVWNDGTNAIPFLERLIFLKRSLALAASESLSNSVLRRIETRLEPDDVEAYYRIHVKW